MGEKSFSRIVNYTFFIYNRNMEKTADGPVQYDGEYVLTSDGSRDFGEIPPETARQIKRQAGKIRLRIGEQEADSQRGYGEKHIERSKRMKEIKLLGFTNARDFVAYGVKNYDAIYDLNR
jgi:hypothetical protein